MIIGKTKVIIRPAMMMIIGGVILGIVGIVAAKQYASGPRTSHGWANPKRWAFATSGSANATLTMLSEASQKELTKAKAGYGNVDMSAGIRVDIAQPGNGPQNVYIRNAIDAEKTEDKNILFHFEGSAPQPFPVIFTIRTVSTTGEGDLLWSKSFTVKGDWKKYEASIPAKSLGNIPFRIVAGQLGSKKGQISLRKIYLGEG